MKIDLLNSIGEKVFIALGILLIPIWFPIICFWALVDPSYRLKRKLRRIAKRSS
jgi:hypothetical protein